MVNCVKFSVCIYCLSKVEPVMPDRDSGSIYAPEAALALDLLTLRVDKETSDLTIECDGVEFPVHSLILRARSDVFRAMLNSLMSEAGSGRIQIEDVDSDAMKLFLEYVTLHYT